MQFEQNYIEKINSSTIYINKHTTVDLLKKT